jgi:hypothetical protein
MHWFIPTGTGVVPSGQNVDAHPLGRNARE